jgi:hypothetical protein
MRLALIWIKQARFGRCISWLVQFYRKSLNDQFPGVHCRKNHEKNKHRKRAVAPGDVAFAGVLRCFDAGASNRWAARSCVVPGESGVL